MNTHNICTLSVALLLIVIPCKIQAQTNTFPSSGNVGIGTTNPSGKLHVNGDGLIVQRNNGTPYIRFLNHGGSLGDKTWVLQANALSDGSFRIRNESNNLDPLNILANGNVGIGTTSPNYKLDINGNIRAEEIVVIEDVGADFVFEESYNLPGLSEVEQHIKTYKHLPEIPSAEEMKQNGVKVGELQMKLLQKIEELTLYTIELQKQLTNTKRSDDLLKKKIMFLEHQIKQLREESNE